MPPDFSSSSDEEDIPRSNIQIPNLNLDNYRRQQHKNSSRSNLARAGKKITGNKSVRFPDLYKPRDTIISTNSSTTNNSSDSDLESVEDIQAHTATSAGLPSFRINTGDLQNEPAGDDDDSDIDDEEDNDLDVAARSHPADLLTDSSDESEPEADNSLLHQEEEDITDQRRESGSSEDKPSAFKDMFRKLSLVDRGYTPGYAPDQTGSDSFLGRVLLSSAGGLSGGGLAPGASRMSREKPLDEEERVAFEEPGSIEMKRLEFEELSEEAKKLISVHVPGVEHQRLPHEGSSTEHNNESTANLIPHKDYESDDGKDGEQFYAPNPDLFLRGDEIDDGEGDDFMLDEDSAEGYIAPPKHVHAGVLSSLLKLYQNPQESKSQSSFLSRESTLADDYTFAETTHSRASTMDFTKLKNGLKLAPKKMTSKIPHKKKKNKDAQKFSSDDDGLIDEKGLDASTSHLPSFQNARPKAPKGQKPKPNKAIKNKLKSNKQKAQRLRITVHIADILQRQRFIIRMCRALMMFGAPTHRLEEYMVMTSRVLEIDGQFIYFPGCMFVAFGDAATRTSEVHLVRCVQGLNLSKLSDTHKIYKAVIHDLIGVEEAGQRLEELLKQKNLYPPWLCVFFYGLGSSMVCPFAFGGGWVDVPISFGVGLCVGYLQFYVSSMSNLYSSVFEVTASIVVSFISRAIGSIRGGKLFCFAAIAQGSLALILPGYIILCGSLELQSRNLVAGSVRMFYAIIYSLFLGFGITLGGALYGWVDKNSVSAQNCPKEHTVNDKFRIIFVPMFSLCLGLINQARWQQLPVMIIISCIGYIGNYFAGKHFSSVTEFTACIGAFIVGILGNLYSRIWKGMAVSAMLPAIFVQVPSGIASQSSLVSGIQAADQITKQNGTSTTRDTSSSLAFGATMVEVSIGISVGLFAAALCVYPFGKKRTGLFTL